MHVSSERSSLGRRLPPGDVALDAEIVAWDVEKGRLDFAALGRRLTAGRRLGSVAAARPAHLVCFDILAAGARRLRSCSPCASDPAP
ncbi:MAG: hypothetical protein ACR2JO_05565 [Mycobacteriales bacterium]